MKVKSQMRCIKIKKKLTRSIYNVRQSQTKILDIQNNWNHDWKPLDQSCLYHSLCATLFFFFLYGYIIFFSVDFSLYFFFFFLFSFTYWEIWPLKNSIFVLYDWPNTLSHLVLKKKKKKEENWLGAQLWMNQVRCSVKQ